MSSLLSTNTNEVRRLKIRSRRLASADFVGSFRSAFRGTGLTFSELQEYQPGDDVRLIDWKASARHNKAFIRSYEEERQLSILAVVDTSRSLYFGSFAKIKSQEESSAHQTEGKFRRAIELVALLSQVARASGDAFGLLTFGRHVEEWLAPKARQHNTERILYKLLQQHEPSRATHINEALQTVEHRLRQRSIIFIISDFLGESALDRISRLSQHHDVITCFVEDPLERALPSIGFVSFADAEGSDFSIVDLGSPAVRKALLQRLLDRKNNFEKEVTKRGAEFFSLQSDAFHDLKHFLDHRNKHLKIRERRR